MKDVAKSATKAGPRSETQKKPSHPAVPLTHAPGSCSKRSVSFSLVDPRA